MELLCLVGLALFILVFILDPMVKAGRKKRYRYKYKGKRRRKRKYNGTIYIYKLMDGRKPFYVGQTRQNPQTRLQQHIEDNSNTNKAKYIRRMRREPRIEVICKTRGQNKANQLENHYIKKWGKTNMRWA